MKEKFIIQEISPELFSKMLSAQIKEHIKVMIRELCLKKSVDELLSRTEACELLKINSSTLWAWTKQGKIIAYGLANRRYYKKQELLQALIPLKNKF
nr:helix-turn-helix domain-containing protein [uncultured Psychroserpens sp.]